MPTSPIPARKRRWWGKRRPALPQVYLPIGWSTYFFSAARVTFNTSEVACARAQARPRCLSTTTTAM